jgi:hypothetical protein
MYVLLCVVDNENIVAQVDINPEQAIDANNCEAFYQTIEEIKVDIVKNIASKIELRNMSELSFRLMQDIPGPVTRYIKIDNKLTPLLAVGNA